MIVLNVAAASNKIMLGVFSRTRMTVSTVNTGGASTQICHLDVAVLHCKNTPVYVKALH